MADGEQVLEVDGRRIDIANPDKPMFPDDGLSKADVVDYYQRIAPLMLPHLRGRPLTLNRFPDGIGADGFVQQNRGSHFPAWMPALDLDHGGHTGVVRHILCETAADLVFLAGQATITLHAWPSRQPDLQHPDRLIFDLDPPGDDFEAVRFAARQVGETLDQAGLTPFLKTTGSRGLHVVAPLYPEHGFRRVRDLARRLTTRLAERYPDRLTVEQRKNKRGGRLYLDIQRNAFGQTSVAPYSLRARPGAPVATPLDWAELNNHELDARRYRLDNLFLRLGQKPDPWAAIDDKAAPLDNLERALA